MLDQENRDALYDAYNKSEGLTDESTVTDDNATDTDADEKSGTDATTDETVDNDGDTSTEKEKEVADDPADKEDSDASDKDDTKTDDAVDAKKDGDDKQKMVPHGLFHEEREKRKFLQKELDTVKSQLDTVLQDYRAIMAKQAEAPKDDEFDEFGQAKAIDPKMTALMREVEELRKFKDQYTKTQQTQQKQQMDNKHAENVKAVNERLEKEGIPGFLFATDAVGREIKRLVAEDSSNAYLWSPDGWYKVYKENVYPKMAGLFTGQDKTDLLEQKKALKGKQKITTKSGLKPSPKSDDEKSDKWTFKDYMDLRKNQTLD